MLRDRLEPGRGRSLIRDYSALLAESVLRRRAWFAEHSARVETELSIVSALNVPVPAHREGEGELWIAELGLVGELVKHGDGPATFNRGVSVYPTLGDRAGFLDSIVDRWRNSSASAADALQSASMFAETVNLPANGAEAMLPGATSAFEERRTAARESNGERRDFGTGRREHPVASAQPAQSNTAVRAMREKLHQR